MTKLKQSMALLLAVALLLCCAACGNAKAPAQSSVTGSAAAPAASEESASAQEPEAEPADESEEALNDGVPWIDYSLRENIALATQRPSPKDDFYLYVNYDWLRSAEIPPGSLEASGVYEVSDRITELCLDVLTDESIEGQEAALARYYYNAWLDWDARNALGVEPVRHITDEIAAVSDLDGLTRLLCRNPLSTRWFFRFDSQPGFNDPGTYIALVEPIQFWLTDAAEYREPTEFGERAAEAFQAAALGMLPKFGYTEAEAAETAQRALALEGEMAGGAMTAAEQMSPDYDQRINNEMSRAEAGALCSRFPWLAILDAWGYEGAQRFWVTQPAYFQQLDAIWQEDHLEDLKAYCTLSAVLGNMYLLDRDSYELSLEMWNAVYGMEGSLPDEEAACDDVRYDLPTAIDRAFLTKYDASKMKQDVTRLCEEAIAYYRTMLEEEDWLAAETREKAIEKLDAMRIHAVYPDTWRDLGGLSFEGLGYFSCKEAIRRDDIAFAASLADQPVDPGLWYCGSGDYADLNDILTTNAYYDPSTNSVTILRGILESPLYREDMSEEALRGAIGFMIGHEISHAFDPSGSQHDAAGMLCSWWTEADSEAFSARAERLIAYYDGMVAFGGYGVQGQNVQGEAVADIAGVKCMLGLLEQKENADYKAFFETFAACLRQLVTRETAYYYLMMDPHPPVFIRINSVVQQFPQFYDAYGVSEGDGMYLAPGERVPVW